MKKMFKKNKGIVKDLCPETYAISCKIIGAFLLFKDTTLRELKNILNNI